MAQFTDWKYIPARREASNRHLNARARAHECKRNPTTMTMRGRASAGENVQFPRHRGTGKTQSEHARSCDRQIANNIPCRQAGDLLRVSFVIARARTSERGVDAELTGRQYPKPEAEVDTTPFPLSPGWTPSEEKKSERMSTS